MNNYGLVFIKPHAITDKAISFVVDTLKARGIGIESEGSLTGDQIEARGIIDRHYFAISNTAMKTDPGNLLIEEDTKKAFSNTFGVAWDAAIKGNQIYNSAQYMEAFSIAGGKELTAVWTAGTFMKLGPGLYVCRVKDSDNFIINGFYPGMREKFTAENARVIWYTVTFDPSELSWKEFRSTLIGATDPSKAAEGSIRNILYEKYNDFGLSAQPSMSDNGVHASAGPIEGMRERMVWAGIDPRESKTGKALMEQGWTGEKLEKLLENGDAVYKEEQGPVFDITEDCDAEDVISGLT